jgi:hypothetical protein
MEVLSTIHTIGSSVSNYVEQVQRHLLVNTHQDNTRIHSLRPHCCTNLVAEGKNIFSHKVVMGVFAFVLSIAPWLGIVAGVGTMVGK